MMVVLSAALLVAAVWLGRNLVERFGAWSATLIAAASYVVAIAIVMLLLPTIDETPDDFPADVLYEFRLYSLGTQFVLWAIIAVVFGSMVHRLLGENRSGRRRTSRHDSRRRARVRIAARDERGPERAGAET